MRDTIAGLQQTIQAKNELIETLTDQRQRFAAEAVAWERTATDTKRRLSIALASLNAIYSIAKATR